MGGRWRSTARRARSGSFDAAPVSVPRERVLSGLMLGLASGAILVPLNSTMLAVALPDVMGEFGLGASQVSSLVSLYLGAVAIVIPIAGTLSDRFGARRTFLAGVLAFGGASLLAAATSSFAVLELARVLQASAGALVSTSSTVLLRETAPESRRGEAFGVFDLLVSTSAAAGPFIGGLIVAAFGWRTMFLLAAPIAVVAALAVGVVLRGDKTLRPRAEVGGSVRRLDIAGLALLGAAIGAFLFGIQGGQEAAPERLGWFAAMAALLVGFVAWELRQDDPAIDPRLFLRRPFAAASLGVFGMTVVLHGCFVVVPLLVELVLREPATTSGTVLLGIAGVSAIVAPFGGRTSDRRGRRLVAIVGSAICALGLFALAVPDAAGSALVVGGLLGVVGLGMGLSGSPRQTAALEAVEADRLGMGSGTYYTSRYVGGAVGASVMGALLGGTVTAGGVSLGFGVLAAAAVGVTLVSFGLPGRVRSAAR
jgi:EmrB/QacA subfamily drug resistance transporter